MNSAQLPPHPQLYWSNAPESIDELVNLLHIHLEEWWHTKRSEAHARKMGKRIA